MRRLLSLLAVLAAPAPAAQPDPTLPGALLHGTVLVADSLLTPETFRSICEATDVEQAKHTFADPFSQPPISLPQGGGWFGASTFRQLAPSCDLAAFRTALAGMVLSMGSFRATDGTSGSHALRERMRARRLAIADTSAPTVRPYYVRTMAMEDARRAWAQTITDEAAAVYAEIQSFHVRADSASLLRLRRLPGVTDAYGATAEAFDRRADLVRAWRSEMEVWMRLPRERRGPEPGPLAEVEWTVPPRSSE